MKIKYDKELDVLYISFSEAKVEESDEEKQGLILDYDQNGSIIGIELLNASKKIPQPMKFEYEVAD
mgnify:CR=1 FL=1|jgi:uncharacterized protein YuzE